MSGDIESADRKSSSRKDAPVSKTIPATPSPRATSNLEAAMLRLPAQERDCGMLNLKREHAQRKLQALVEGTELARQRLSSMAKPAGNGRVAVVTGGASGIGRATCGRLRADGHRVVAIDVGDGGADGAELAIRADVGDADEVERAFDEVLSRLGRIDVLVNNAGISGSQQARICHTTPVEEWDRMHTVNVRGPFLCTRAALPAMLQQGSGHVITIASIAGLVAFPARCAYTASKGAAVMFTKSIAADYAAHGIRANAVCPGFVQSPMTQWRLDIPELRAKVEALIPMGRVARAEEIAQAVAMLAGDSLTYLTGHALVVDGGWTAV
jgi:NAD(P)-dependent dehydrogenase (short-subunit alcohol dehydrogenase family)